MAELKIDFEKMAEGFTKTAKEKGMFVGWWIPVSEKLPEKSTWVLVTCKNSDGYIFLDIKLINQYTGLWDGDEDFSGTVLAWMPLPHPYEPQESEVSDADSD